MATLRHGTVVLVIRRRLRQKRKSPVLSTAVSR